MTARNFEQLIDARRAFQQLNQHAEKLTKAEGIAPADALIRAMELHHDLAHRAKGLEVQDGFNPSTPMINRAADICWQQVQPFVKDGSHSATISQGALADMCKSAVSQVMSEENITADQALRVVAHCAPAMVNAAETLGLDNHGPSNPVKVTVEWRDDETRPGGAGSVKTETLSGVPSFIHKPEPTPQPPGITPGGPQSRPYVPYDPSRGFAMDQLQVKADELAKTHKLSGADALVRAMELNPELARAAQAESKRA